MSTFHENSDQPTVDFDQEVRFAVVLYGGSSLAIYINGVAQELLRLVRATAPEGLDGSNRAHLRDDQLRGSERVYRRLGRLLGRQGVRPEYAAVQDSQSTSPIRTRFVVDIVTGTSAGGINGVYLAKALANNQDMDELKQLWVSEGDIGILINDEESYKGLKINLTDDTGEPWSVLNSRRMYLKLLQALRGMDEKRPVSEDSDSPLVDELDLFVTATDMQGRILQLRLADKVVSEYRHRNVFRFRYRSKRASDSNQNKNDFESKYNAFLAFVARATSAHQAAFSPIKLDDVTPIVGRYPFDGEFAAAEEALRAFYNDYLLQVSSDGAASGKPPDANTLAEAFRSIWFVDGGTLDNKPFSFVVGELPLRHADTFVDRKLLYVEPSPEHLSRTKSLEQRPRIVKNALAALTGLPRYETIVEDLTRLLERNRMIERLDNIMRGMEADLIKLPPKKSRSRENFLEMLGDRDQLLNWMQSQGPSWGSYLRLRVAEVTDDLTLLVARAAGFNEESDEFLAIRYLVREWRASRYDTYMADGKRSELEFLVEFDLLWAVRRIQFVIKKLNDLGCLSENDANARRIAGIPLGEESSSVYPADEGDYAEYRDAAQSLRSGLNKIFVKLRGERRTLWSAGLTNPFITSISHLQLTSRHLLELLREPTNEKRRTKAKEILNASIDSPAGPEQKWSRGDAVEDLAKNVKGELKRVAVNARNALSQTLRPPKENSQLPRWELFLRKTLWYYYISFEDFDQIAYPLLYSTGAGAETDVIDVFRVSPEDATALIDENNPIDHKGESVTDGSGGRRVKKLAGSIIGNFGAFFEKKFRINDIMWGRLDAAERIIATVLPEHSKVRDQMIEQAHRAIIVEEHVFADQKAADNKDLQALVWDALDVWDDKDARLKLLDQATQKLSSDTSSAFREYMNTLRGGAEPRDLFRQSFASNYDAERKFTADATLNSAVRVNRVLNSMAGGYLSTGGKPRWWQRLLMFFGRRLRTFIEAAIQPDGPARRRQVWRLALFYVVALLIFVLVCLPSVFLLRSDAWRAFGVVAIVLTAPLAFIPLALAIAYSYLWRKLRRKLVGLLPSG